MQVTGVCETPSRSDNDTMTMLLEYSVLPMPIQPFGKVVMTGLVVVLVLESVLRPAKRYRRVEARLYSAFAVRR